DYCQKVIEQVEQAKANNEPMESVQQVEAFKPLFVEFSDVVSLTTKSEEMHARNIQIIWKYIED
ncbi:MAG: hypothetical protein JW798_14035, partial [Prolixibacteraceae bacterium]|nr:hypothetical protein [Prolixibacteraceae bacterium]